MTVLVVSDQAGTARATGVLHVPGASKTFTLGPTSATVVAGQRRSLPLKLSHKAIRALKSAFARHLKARVDVTVSVTNAAGAVASTPRTIWLIAGR